MRRIAGPGATGDNKFTKGNPATSVAATQVTDTWLNDVQETLMAPIEAAGLTGDATTGQLLTAIRALNVSVPAGTLAPRQATTPNMTVRTLPGFVYNGNAPVAVAAFTTPSIPTAVNNPRIDRLVYDLNTYAISVVQGTEAASPVPPALPAGAGPIAQIAVAKSATAITDGNITDERAQPGQSLLTGEIKAYGGTAAPAGYLLCYGQAVSRTTYATLFGVIGTANGAGDGSTTFNLPDLRGTILLGKDNMGGTAAGRVTTAGSTVDGATLGARGGSQLMPQHNHGVTDPGHRHFMFSANSAASSASTTIANATDTIAQVSSGFPGSYASNYSMTNAQANTVEASMGATNTASSGVSVNNAGTGTAANMPPVQVVNYIIKI